MAKQKTFSAKLSEETADLIQAEFERSGAFTKDEFLKKLLKKPNEKPLEPEQTLNVENQTPAQDNPEKQTDEPLPFQGNQKPAQSASEPIITKPVVIEIEPKLERNEILISLNPEQLFALRETVLSSEDFAAEHNILIDDLLSNNKPFLYFGKLYDTEFQGIWIKYQEITRYMTEEQKEHAVKHNMAAFLLNVFYRQLIEDNLSDSVVTAENLKEFIRKNSSAQSLPLQGARKRVQTIPELQNFDSLTIETERKLKPNEILISLNPEQLYALSETVLGSEDFASEHNSLLDDVYNNKRPFLYFGNLYDSEFHGLWVRFHEITENMSVEQKESAIKHNMVAFLLNVVYIQLLMGNTDSVVNTENLKAYIQENALVKPDIN